MSKPRRMLWTTSVLLVIVTMVSATACGGGDELQAGAGASDAPGTTFRPGPPANIDPSEVNGPRERFPDQGPPGEIEHIKTAVLPALLADAKLAFALPKEPAAREAYASAALAAQADASAGPPAPRSELTGPELIQRTWVKPIATKKEDSFHRSLEAALNDPQFSGYSDYRLEIKEWLGVAVDGHHATASFIGVSSYDRNGNAMVPEPVGWVSDFEQQFDIDIDLEETWRLASEATYRTDRVTGY